MTKSTVLSSRPNAQLLDMELRLSSPESLKLFSESVRALAEYEREAKPQALEVANEKLQRCVEKYPQDLLPRFYLGISKSLTSYKESDAAIAHLQFVVDSNVESLRLPAKYNLAAAYIDKYSTEHFQLARKLLDEIIDELKQREKSAPGEGMELRLLAEAVVLFIDVRQELWVMRLKGGDFHTLKDLSQQLERRLDAFRNSLAESVAEQIGSIDTIYAEYFNARGLFEESIAYFLPPVERQLQGRLAVEAFRKSLTFKRNWASPTANMARVYLELLNDLETSYRLFLQLTQGFEQNQYANYYLGQICLRRSPAQKEQALEFLSQSPAIPEANALRAKTLQELQRWEEARNAWKTVLKVRPQDSEALAAMENLPSPPTEPIGNGPDASGSVDAGISF